MSDAAVRWTKVLIDAEHSGLSIRRFALSKGLNPSTLAWWKWKLNQVPRGRESPNPFVEVELASANPLQVQIGRAIVHVDRETDFGLLRRVVEELT